MKLRWKPALGISSLPAVALFMSFANLPVFNVRPVAGLAATVAFLPLAMSVLLSAASDAVARRAAALTAIVVLLIAGFTPLEVSGNDPYLFVTILVVYAVGLWYAIPKARVFTGNFDTMAALAGVFGPGPPRDVEQVQAELEPLATKLDEPVRHFIDNLPEEDRDRLMERREAESDPGEAERVAPDEWWLGRLEREVQKSDEPDEFKADVARMERLNREMVAAAVKPAGPLLELAEAIVRTTRTFSVVFVAVCFVLFWLCVYMVGWAIDPKAWEGLGTESVRFGEFVYLSVGAAFGGGGGLDPTTTSARLVQVIQTITVVVFFSTYVQGLIHDDGRTARAGAPASRS